MPRVARVFHHLGDPDAGADERRVNRLVKRDRAAGVGRVVVTDDRQRRLPEVFQRRALAQKLGVHRHAKTVAVRLAGRALQRRDDNLVRGSRQHGAADDHDVIITFVAERPADFPLTLQAGGRDCRSSCSGADAEQRDLAAVDGVGGVGRRAKPPFGAQRPSRSSSPGSTMGLHPALIEATLSVLTSTPTTSWPSPANAAAETQPT